MIEQFKLAHLQCSFPKLTETNQHYVLGLVEGLKHSQVTNREKQVQKTPDNNKGYISVIHKC
ncbi:MAG: hypothetical protein FWD47_04260 [Treponema sp.]|nr:hypothetical protein [Treponema sp.]